MKKALCFICVCMLLVGSASAYVSPSMIERAGEIKTELQSGENTEQLVGEATILMLENNVLNELTTNGEEEYAADLKSSADAALDASASDAENAQTLAVDFVDKLVAVPLDTFYKTGDGCYIPVQELEHYALTVDNSTKNDTYISVTVAFLSAASDDAAVTMTAYTYNTKSASAYSSLVRVMYNENNVFNFTTPKGCKYIKVSAADYDDETAAELSLPITGIEITDEVINNGEVNFTGNTGTRAKVLPGWYASENHDESYYDSTVSNEYFVMDGNTQTNLYQTLTLKEGSVYCLSFKFAQKAATGETLKYNHPTLYFGTSIGTIEKMTTSYLTQAFEDIDPLKAPPATASDWTEYKIYFVAAADATDAETNGTTGLVQVPMYPRNVATSTPGAAYYDAFSVLEVDEGIFTGYVKDNGMSVSGKDIATKVRYHYVQKTAGQTQKLIHVTYDASGAISDVEVIDVGKDLALGGSENHDITITDSTSKIFLWDGATLTPQRDPIENYNLD